MITELEKLWRNEYIQTIAVIGIVALFIFGFWYGLQVALNTSYPALAVISGSMCVPYNGACDGWAHPFSHTLHIGDLIIVQGVNPKELNTNYPNSDIIVFKKPSNPDELIVHRIVAVDEINGTLYFRTKGDGNSHVKWPNTPSPLEYDPWDTNGIPGIREDYVVGKVIMRIPWLGHIVLFMRNSVGLPIIIALIIILVIIEFIVPLFKEKQKQNAQVSA
ncbi:MAG: hypothetical protein ACPLIG_07400 [Candidatus Bathyarchaeales archaeon]